MVSMEWLVVCIAFLGLEAAFGCLVSLWFAAGALGAWISVFLGVSLEGQLGVFMAVSFLVLFLVRPAAFFIKGIHDRCKSRAEGDG